MPIASSLITTTCEFELSIGYMAVRSAGARVGVSFGLDPA